MTRSDYILIDLQCRRRSVQYVRPSRNVIKLSIKRVTKYFAAVLILKYEWYGGLWGAQMKSSIVKHSIVIDGHKTSVSLEDAFWSELKGIAHAQKATLGKLVAVIDATRGHGNLSSAIRLYVLEYFRTNGAGVDLR